VIAQDAKFTATFAKGSFASALADDGLVGTADAKDASVNVPVSITFNTTIYKKTQPQIYNAKKDKTGATKSPK